MNWQRDGKYAIRTEGYVVNKGMGAHGWVYTAVKLGRPSVILGHGATAEHCKALCEMDAEGKR